MLQNYLRQPDRVLNSIRFDYQGGRYNGRGVMTWHPDKGFHIEAPVERVGPLPRRIGIGAGGIVRENDLHSFRMRERNASGWILAPEVIMRDRLDLIIQERLSVHVPRIIISTPVSPRRVDGNTWQGRVLLRLSHNNILPDRVIRQERINDQELGYSWESSGIQFESEAGQRVLGRIVEREYLELSYTLPRESWSHAEAWHWAEAVCYALCICLGQTVALLQRELSWGNKLYKDIRSQRPIQDIRPFAPLGNEPIIERSRFIELSNFLARQGRGAEVCKRIFFQIAEAAGQETWQGTALLLTTILEAALRTLEGHPFQLNDRSFRLRVALENFRERYLSLSWVNTFERAYETYRRLRHRNAHPDWLYEQTGALSDNQREETFNDMVFLSRFYGYMMLALVGNRDLPPPP